MKTYRVYGDDNDIRGGPIFSPMILKEVKAPRRINAIKKVYSWSKKNRLGWDLQDLSARLVKE